MGASTNLTGAGSDTTTRKGAPVPLVTDRIEPGTEIAGRYWVLEWVDAGGMGNVYRAYDARLRREVALKQLHVANEDAEARLAREAQAMAQLNHPNVVAVYDAVADGTRLTLAMEFVRGPNLSRWLVAGRTWTEIVDAFIGAGRGLEAAHDKGFVHRDFKPGNVIVADDGRVRVTDFGLAKTVRDELSPIDSDSAPPDIGDFGGNEDLTEAGSVVGTPRYMSPEQHTARGADDKSDQFAFCVSLWEALCGHPPYPGPRAELAAQKSKGPPAWAGPAAVPRSIASALARGLAPQSTDRWPSMTALLAAIEGGRSGRRASRRLLLGAVVTAGAVAAAVWSARRPGPCDGVDDALAETWDEDRAESLRAQVIDTKLGYAPRSAELVAEQLDTFAESWTKAARDNCEATHLRGQQSAAQLDRSARCLRQARSRFEAAIDTVGDRADARAIQGIVSVTHALPDPRHCRDPDWLAAAVPLPAAEVAAEVERLDAEVARANALDRAGDARRSLALLDEIASDVEATEYGPLVANVAYRRGRAARRLGELDVGVAAQRKALSTALAAGDDSLAIDAAVSLAELLGYDQSSHAEALLALDTADAMRGRPGVEARMRVWPRAMRGLVLNRMGRTGEAIEQLRRAYEDGLKTYASGDREVLAVASAYGTVLYDSGFNRDALEIHGWHLAQVIRILGESHPEAITARLNRALALGGLGRLDEAATELRRTRDHVATVFDETHRYWALCQLDLSVIEHQRGNADVALELADSALGGMRAAIGDAPHVLFANTHAARARALLALERSDEGAEAWKAARQAAEAAGGPDHPQAFVARLELIDRERSEGRAAGVEDEAREVLAQMERALPEDHGEVSHAREVLANVLVELGQAAEAKALIETVMREVDMEQLRPTSRAVLEFELARALLGVGETAEAHALALKARAALLDAEHGYDADRALVDTIDDWLAERVGLPAPG